MDWIDFRALEQSTTLDELPALHRRFLRQRGHADADTMPLRRVQQAVERELNAMRQDGTARSEGSALLVEARFLQEQAEQGRTSN